MRTIPTIAHSATDQRAFRSRPPSFALPSALSLHRISTAQDVLLEALHFIWCATVLTNLRIPAHTPTVHRHLGCQRSSSPSFLEYHHSLSFASRESHAPRVRGCVSETCDCEVTNATTTPVDRAVSYLAAPRTSASQSLPIIGTFAHWLRH